MSNQPNSPILDRYVFREVLQTWIAVLAVLMFILIANRFARFLGEAAAGTLPRDAVMELLGLMAIYYLIVLMPVGLLIAVMLATGRLYRDSEMVAMLGCGVSVSRIFKPIFALGSIIAIVMLFMTLVVGPWASDRSLELRAQAQQEAQYGNLEAGRFRVSDGGSTVFYSEAQQEGGRLLSRVFVQRQTPEGGQVIYAPRAEQRLDEETGDRWLVLYDGVRYDGEPGTAEFQRASFREHGIPIRPEAAGPREQRRSGTPTMTLISRGEIADLAELQWRLTGPISVIVLLALSVPLSKSAPREGRYGKLLLAVFAYVIYSNLLGASQIWMQRGSLPPWIGLWWVHIATLILAGVLLSMQYGLKWRLRGGVA
jgi:lipopolysaccharide export system permease protein